MHNSLREQTRQADGRAATPTAALVDSQSVRGAETVGKPSRSYDAGKKVNGRKRHIAVDTCGLLLAVLVTGAGVQDRDAARPLLWALRVCFPMISLTWADSGYAGKLVDWAHTHLGLTLTIVAKLADQVGFVVLHRSLLGSNTASMRTRWPSRSGTVTHRLREPRHPCRVGPAPTERSHRRKGDALAWSGITMVGQAGPGHGMADPPRRERAYARSAESRPGGRSPRPACRETGPIKEARDASLTAKSP
jgi:hypothetical protein